MKPIKSSCFFLCLLAGMAHLYADNTAEYQKASSYLDRMGEVNFTFFIDSPEQIRQLSTVVSLDKIIGSKVYANANREGFEEFLTYDLYYEVEPPPCETAPAPAMSDYEGVKFPLFDWTKYPTYQGYLNIMAELESTYPDKVKVTKLGESVQGRDLLIANVSTNVGERECEPQFLFNCGIHGDELFPIIVGMRLIDWLCSNYGSDERATKILDSVDLWVSPMLNPDGTYRGGDNTVSGAIRRNANNEDLNRNYTRLPGLGSPNYQKETLIYMAFEKENHFVMQIGWHSGSEGISYPWSCIPRYHPDDAWYNYVSRKYADKVQDLSPSGYFDNINNGAGQGYYHLYPATGTEKDCILYVNHCRANCFESTSQKIFPESQLNEYWGYHLDPICTYILEMFNGIRGTVVDEVTKEGLPAKVWVENHDTNQDSSFMYADVPFGNYYRPIFRGTYSVTYSCEGCESKTINNISVENDRGTIVNVELDCGSTGRAVHDQKTDSPISISHSNNSIHIDCGSIKGISGAAVYNVRGKLVQTLAVLSDQVNKRIMWNGLNAQGSRVNAGCYVVHIETSDGSVVTPFMLTH